MIYILEGNNSVFNRIEELFFDIIKVDPSAEIALDYELFSQTFLSHKTTLVAKINYWLSSAFKTARDSSDSLTLYYYANIYSFRAPTHWDDVVSDDPF